MVIVLSGVVLFPRHFKAHRLLYESTLSLRVIKKKKGVDYMGTSLIRNRHPLGPYSGTMPRSYGGPMGRGAFL